MKNILVVLALFQIGISSVVIAQANKDHMGIGQQLKFSSEQYQLTRSEKPFNNYFIQEYIRSEETPNNFTKSIVVMGIIDTISTERMVGIRLKELEKYTEKNVKSQILFNGEGGIILEFTMNDEKFHFWNIQRFYTQKLSNGESIIAIYTYVERKPITALQTLKSITDNIANKRVGFITEVGEIILPKINL